MKFLLDTNIISEVRKGARCDPKVAAWFAAAEADDLYLSVLVIGEIRRGIETARRRDQARAEFFEQWLTDLGTAFADHILPVDARVGDECGRISAIRTVPVIDALLAATAKANGMALATRNERNMTGLGVEVLNPFRFGET